MASLRCDRCGATQTTDSAFCSYCGSRIIRPDQLKTELTSATDPARFDLVRASPGYELAMAHQPKPAVVVNIVAPIVMLILLVPFIIIAATHVAGDRHAPIGFQVFFFAVPAAMAIMSIVMIAKGLSYAKAPIERDVRVVVGEREDVRPGPGDGQRGRTLYYATLQDRNGARVEYETESWLAGRIAATDIGVAFLKGMRLVDFLRIEPK